MAHRSRARQKGRGQPASTSADGPSVPLGARALRLGARGERVQRLQQRLRGLGLEPGPDDGRYGPLTLAAVRALQRRLGLPADGVADRRLLTALSDPTLVHIHQPVVIAELHPALGPAAVARAVARHAQALTGVGVPIPLPAADEEGAAAMAPAHGSAAAAAGLDLWHTWHTRIGGPGQYDPDKLPGLVHGRRARDGLVARASGLADRARSDVGEDPKAEANLSAFMLPPRLFLDLGPVAWGDGGHVVRIVRRISRALAARDGQVIVSVPLPVAGARRHRLFHPLDLSGLANSAALLVLVPPLTVPAWAPGKFANGLQPPSPQQLSAALREVVRQVPSWRCLLLVPLGALILDAGPVPNDEGPPPVAPTQISYHEAVAMAYGHRTRPHWDETIGRPVFHAVYKGRPVTVWLENRTSVQQKLALVELRRLGGVYFAALGVEDARIWSLLRDRWALRR